MLEDFDTSQEETGFPVLNRENFASCGPVKKKKLSSRET